ncbi:protein TASOR 2 isoform X1 [Podarcis raffonei]|uniref:protein TASOR 2 isoform X1 n=2 Tax=Podarcis raffonei TaxID=65483 RepID=UPI0023296E17|nr:protein TASOR 2 isoform X1 [Podarcis raffonei]XP_053261043.1 protein TASOR 2 isoform X1 [Podarcis raffonei]
MSPSNHKSSAERKTKALYCSWKGQLFIQQQRLCDIVLRSPFSGSIPAELPARLEIRYVVGISELRKKLPEAVFGENSYTNHEGTVLKLFCHQGILFRLYEVEMLNQNEQKVNQLTQSLKEKDLALVKYLNDRAILILLSSSALVKEKDSGPGESTCLQALFLISSQSPKCLTAKDLKCEHGANKRYSQVALVLPGLHHALVEAAKHPVDSGDPLSTLVKLHLQEFAKLDKKNLQPSTCSLDSPPLSSFDEFSKKPELESLSEKCPQSSLFRLQFYLSHPQNYVLEMSTATAFLHGRTRSSRGSGGSSNLQEADTSSGLNLDSLACHEPIGTVETARTRRVGQPAPHSKEADVEPSEMGEWTLEQHKRKSSRLLVANARKKLSPPKEVSSKEDKGKQKKARKENSNLSLPASKNSESPGGSNEPTLKLKILQNPLRRKRGAEVLSAEFVQQAPCESAAKAAPSSESLGVEEKKSRVSKPKKDSTAEKVSSEKMSTRNQMKRKSSHQREDEIPPASDENDPSSERSPAQDASPSPKVLNCDSHALNLLADLALSSNSPLLSNSSGASLPPSPSRERRRLHKGKHSDKSSDHEYHRVTKKLKTAPFSGKTGPESDLSPEQSGEGRESPSSSHENNPAGSSKRRAAKPSLATPPREMGYLSDSSIHSLISSEHSYASPVSESCKKGAPGTKNGVKNARLGPLVGKVMPFRHQQRICHPHKQLRGYIPFTRSAVMAARLKEDFSKSHKVTFCDKTVKVTFQWEADYPPNLDSKYTNNILERTVVRAVHGPWDTRLLDDSDEMMRILHMWVALFYNKPFRSPTIRNVVEHRNPPKFVSLRSIVDAFEVIDDDCEGPYSLEKCPADSLSDDNRTPREADERAVSSSEKPLSCNELSSTNCIDEAPIVIPDDPSDLPEEEEEESHAAAGKPKEKVNPSDKVAVEKPDEELTPDPALSAESQSRSLTDEHTEGRSRPQERGTDAEATASVDLAEVSQSDAASKDAEVLENSASKQPSANTMAGGISAEISELKASSPSAEKEEDSPQSGGAVLLRPAEIGWLEADSDCGEVNKLCREGRGSQDLPVDEEDIEGESTGWESIELALSDSNDTDSEPRDMDLDQENKEEEGCPIEGREAARASTSPVTFPPSPATVSEHQAESPGTQDDFVLSTPSSASLDPTDAVKGFCLSQKDREDNLLDSLPLRTSPVNQITRDEVAQSPETEDAVELAKHPMSPNQMDVAESTRRSQEDNKTNLEDSASAQAAELKDMATRGESVESRDSIVLANSPKFPSPVGSDDTSFGSTEEKGMNLADSVSLEASPVHQTSPDDVIELPTAQEDSAESTKHHISLNQMDLIEDISQEEGNLTDPSPLKTCGPCQVQSSPPVQGESTGKQENSALSAPNLAPEKEIDLVAGSCVSPEEEGIRMAEVVKLQVSPVYQAISDEEEDLPGNQERSAENSTLTKQTRSAEDSCIPEEKDALHLVGVAPLQANELRCNTATQEERKARQTTERLGNSQGQSWHLDNEESDTSTDNQKCGVNSEDIEVSPAPRESASDDDKLSQAVVTVPEDIRSFLYELIDTVSGMMAVSKETAFAKENPALNWISSVTLECVTPPESDEESYATDKLAHYDPKWAMTGDSLAQPSNKRDSHMAVQRYGWYHSALQGSISSGQVAEKKSHQETGAATDTLESSCCPEWEDTGIRSPERQFPLIQTAALCGVDPGQVSSEASMFEDQLRKAGREVLPFVPSVRPTECLSEESGSSAHKDTHDLYKNPVENLEDPEDAPAGERPVSFVGATGVNINWENKCVSVDGVPELCGDVHPRGQPEIPSTRSAASPDAMEMSCASDLSCENELHKGEGWVYLENKVTVPDVEAETIQYDWPSSFREGDRSVLPSPEESGPLKDYLNFTITKKHQEKNRSFQSSKRRSPFFGEQEWKNFSDRAWRVLNDPIQSTLDMECLRFHDKLKHTLKKPQPPTSGEGTPERVLQVTAETLPSRKVPEAPELSVPPRSRSPLLITILNRGPRHSAPHGTPRSRHSDPFEPPPPFASAQESVSNAARTKGQGKGPGAPFHLNKLTYNNKLKDSRGDISVIMDEFAELSRLMTQGDRQASFAAREPNPTSEDALEKRGPSLPRRTTSYEHLFTELCSTLHFKLKTVAQEACKKPYAFYLVETGDSPFFGRLKNLLKKGSHVEMKPLHFCKTSHPEGDRLMVIIRNEDIYPHIYKIPSLLRLKRFPSVTFVGVDNPEDIFDNTHQELFHSGGFVVSDDKVLEAMTVGELKDAAKTLEKLNCSHGRWSWLLHYKETKRLREDARKDPAAHAKEMLLKSCQGSNITEVLHYHQCDSKSSPRSEHLNCLLNLQVQHISRRFAVFLTEKPSASRETMENKGILVLDVNTFVATAESLAAPFRSGCW